MSDVSTVKAEIKAWERSFKAENGREPNIQDIKDLPDIAAKYKLYKKLSKTASASAARAISTRTTPDPLSTPPRSRSTTHQLIQPRAFEPTAPLSSFNPFSPQKNKANERASPSNLRSKPSASPFKPKVPSHDPFPVLDVDKPSTSSHTTPHSPSDASSALFRARKRLRGDPVSPSPNKQKRRRVGSQLTLPFTKLPSDSDSEDSDAGLEKNSTFMSDSPVKAPLGAKSFKLLFDETAEPKGAINGRSGAIRTKTQSTSRQLFGVSSLNGNDDDALWDIGSKTKATLFKPASNDANATKSLSTQTQLKRSNKRPLSDTDDREFDNLSQQLPPPPVTLIPPSPPPTESFGNRPKLNSNTRGKAEPSRRKKAKTSADSTAEAQDDEANDESDSHTTVKIVKRGQLHVNYGTDQLDSDPIFGYPHRGFPRGHELQPSVGEQEARLEVDLPDKLRRMLALDTKELKARDSRAERLVKGLVLGQRTDHYNPVKGGEIWDVGEDDVIVDGDQETRRDAGSEDDWEGEPVPWEIGEL